MTIAFAPVPLFFAVIFRMIFLLSLTLSIEHFRTNDKEEGGCVDQIKRVEIALLTEKTITMIRTIQRLTMSIDDSADKDAPTPPPAGPKSAATLRAEKQLKKQIRILFDQVDADGSGEISADELKTIFFKLNYAGSDDPDCSGIARKVILAVDDGEGGDEDPEISFDELFNHLVSTAPSPQSMSVMVDKIFAMVDVDGSGDISSDELFTFLGNLGMGAGSISDVEKIIDQIDEDGDNSIDKKELKKFLIKNMA